MITLLYLVCPDVLSTVGETSYGIRVGFIESDIVFTIYLFISEVQHLLLSSGSNTNYILTKEKHNCPFPPELLTFLFSVTTLYTTSLVPLSYSTASVSMPVPLSAANQLSCSKLSVSSSSLDES